MKLPHPFIQLPLSFDAPRMEAEIAALGDAPWRDHPQKFAGNTMLPLIALDGDAENEGFRGQMKPTPELGRCPYLQQVIEAVGVTAGRTRLMRLAGQAEVSPHADQDYYWADRVRVHVPVKTQPTVRFQCGKAEVNMAAGECWIFDTWRMHRVINANDDQRIHLVIDTVGGEGFWKHVEAGRAQPNPAPNAAWSARFVGFDPDRRPELALEAYNLPTIMTPWEAEMRLSALMGEIGNHAMAPQIGTAAARFIREWRALWARYGERDEGISDYVACLDRFIAGIQEPARQIRLANDVLLFNVMMTWIGRVAIAAAPATPAKNPAPAYS